MAGVNDDEDLVVGTEEGDLDIDLDLGTDEAPAAGGDKPKAEEPPKGEERARDQNKAETDREEETPEERRERRRQERTAKRERHQRQATGDLAMVASLTEAFKATAEELKRVKGTVVQMETEKVANLRDYWLRMAKTLRAKNAAAIENGNGTLAVDLQDQYERARANALHFDGLVNERQREAQETLARQETKPQPQDDAEAVKKATIQNNGLNFIKRFPYYDPGGQDADSRLIRKIDKEVSDDGFDPASVDYWIELESRLGKAGLDPDTGDEPAPRQRQETRNDPARSADRPRDPATGQFRPQGGPPVGGRTESGGTKLHIPAKFRPQYEELKKSMIEANQWDNPKVRTKVVSDWAKRQGLMK
jgi:hypothetical protein